MGKSDRITTSVFDHEAICKECGWRVKANNAVPLAAIHCDRYGHEVSVELRGTVRYVPATTKGKRKKKRR